MCINLIGLAYGLAYPVNYDVWLNRAGKNKETDQEHDEDCVEEEFQLDRVKFERDAKGEREALGIGYCSSNTWNGLEIKLA